MAPWHDLERERPDLASAGRELLYPFNAGVGLGFLGTVRSDGGPRLHPMCPIITSDGLFCVLTPSPKRDDLHRDQRYALHSYPPPDNEDAFYIRGVARHVLNESLAGDVENAFWAERGMTEPPRGLDDDQQVFSLDIERILLTRTTGHGDPAPQHTIWRTSP